MNVGQQEYEVHLPIGYTDENGSLHRRAVLRKMRGYDEELIYDLSLSAGELVTELLTHCLIQVGDIETSNKLLAKNLYTVDRNFLLLELRRISLGNELDASYICPSCGSNLNIKEQLDQIDVHKLKDNEVLEDIQLTLDDGYTDKKGSTHTEITLTLPIGADEEFVASMINNDPMRAQEALFLRCIKNFGNLSKAALESYGIKILRELTIGDRQRMQKSLNEKLPGPDLRRSIHCGSCGTSFEGILDISNFFVMG